MTWLALAMVVGQAVIAVYVVRYVRLFGEQLATLKEIHHTNLIIQEQQDALVKTCEILLDHAQADIITTIKEKRR